MESGFDAFLAPTSYNFVTGLLITRDFTQETRM